MQECILGIGSFADSDLVICLFVALLSDVLEPLLSLLVLVDGLLCEFAVWIVGDLGHLVKVEVLGLCFESLLRVVIQTEFFVLDQVFAYEEEGEADDGACEEEQRRDLGSIDYLLEL